MASPLLSPISRMVERFRVWIQPADRSLPSSSSPSFCQVQQDIEQLQRVLPRIGVVLNDAEDREILDESVGLWLQELRDIAYDAEDVLDEYEYELLRAEVEMGIQGNNAPDFPRKRKHGEMVEYLCQLRPHKCGWVNCKLITYLWLRTPGRILMMMMNSVAQMTLMRMKQTKLMGETWVMAASASDDEEEHAGVDKACSEEEKP